MVDYGNINNYYYLATIRKQMRKGKLSSTQRQRKTTSSSSFFWSSKETKSCSKLAYYPWTLQIGKPINHCWLKSMWLDFLSPITKSPNWWRNSLVKESGTLTFNKSISVFRRQQSFWWLLLISVFWVLWRNESTRKTRKGSLH